MSMGTFIIVPTFLNVNSGMIKVTAAISTTTWNKDLQLKYSTKYPDNVGPIAGANPITRPNIPIYLPRSLGPNISKIVLSSLMAS